MSDIDVYHKLIADRARLLNLATLQLNEALRVNRILLREAGIGVTDLVLIEQAKSIIAEIEATK